MARAAPPKQLCMCRAALLPSLSSSSRVCASSVGAVALLKRSSARPIRSPGAQVPTTWIRDRSAVFLCLRRMQTRSFVGIERSYRRQECQQVATSRADRP